MKPVSKFRATLSYGLVQATLWSFFAIWINFSSNFLYRYGFSDGQISLMLGSVTALSIVVQLVLAELVSSSRKLRMYHVMLCSGGVMLLCALWTILLKNLPVAAIGCFGVSCMLLQTFPAMANSLGVDAMERGAPVIFGLARGCGSLFYSMTAFCTGLLVGRFSSEVLGFLGVAAALLFLCGVALFHHMGERGLPERVKRAGESTGKDNGFLRKYPRFAFFLLGSILLCYSQNLMSNFLMQVMMAKGGDAADQGLAAAISAVVEIPVMFSFVLIRRWMRCDKWVRLSCFFFVVKALGMYLATTPEGVWAAQVTQMLAWGLFNISTINYAAEVVGKGEAVRAQSYLASTLTVGSLIAMSTGGVMCQFFGVQTMLLLAALIAALGTVVVLLSAQKTR